MEKRETAVFIRMSESELEQIRERMEQFGTTNMSAFIRKMAIDGYIIKLELPELKEMTRLLSAYSNNLNQIAKRVNSTSQIYSADLEEIRQNQESLWDAAENSYVRFQKSSEAASLQQRIIFCMMRARRDAL